MPTNSELLQSTKLAIQEILDTGQSVTGDGRSLSHANLAELRQTVDWLEGRIAATHRRGRSRVIQVNPRL